MILSSLSSTPGEQYEKQRIGLVKACQFCLFCLIIIGTWVYSIYHYFQGSYVPVGDDQGQNFSELEAVSIYVPQGTSRSVMLTPASVLPPFICGCSAGWALCFPSLHLIFIHSSTTPFYFKLMIYFFLFFIYN